MPDSDLTTLIAAHEFDPIARVCKCGVLCGVVCDGLTWAAHVAAVLSGVYAITPLPEANDGNYWKAGSAMLRRDAPDALIEHYEENAASQLAVAKAARAQEAPQ